MMKYIFGLAIVLGLAVAGFLYDLYDQIKDDVDKVVNYSPKQSTQFFDKEGRLLANTFKDENREYVKYDDIPARVIEGLVAIEDTQFFEHWGINPDAISRAMIKNLKAGGFVEGASTLTQQLIKNLTLTREKKLMRKVKEALLAIRLETILTKEEILERYLNHTYFGHGYYGIKTAAKGYFNKDLYELSLKEIAILVGLPRAPSFYDPTRNLQVSLARANQVITRLDTLGWITKEQYEEAINETPTIHNQTLTKNVAPYAIDYAISQLINDVPDIIYGGYKVYLTIDLDAQEMANDSIKRAYEEALKRDLEIRKNSKDPDNNPYTKELNAAMITMESSTGKILAMVGGVDYNQSVFNRAFQSKRQAGSAIKPFLYQTALNEGYNPASQLFDISRTYNYTVGGVQKKWQPKNYGGNFQGIVTLRDSLTQSRNLSTLNLVTDVGVGVVTNDLKTYGFKDIVDNLSITLGSMSVSLVEFSEAYSTFANNGTQVKPYIVEQIVNKDGKSVTFEPQTKEINKPEQNYLMVSILNDVVNKGTGKRAAVEGIELAGKTGTTNDNIDAWFCGFSPSIQTIVWFGQDDNTPMRKSETGSTLAAPAFSYFFKKYLALHPEIPRTFTKPEGVYVGNFNGKDELYTDMSPLPDIDSQILIDQSNSNEEVLEF
ncbi:transglycosylase domain-containing protein [Aliarcobacter butzleri]|uniref:transglycosylase domain-containing protein n=1 Tax=Aliarcobacter butzleri TaxID=28197 RepID=UPI000DB3EFA4|nr:PBP1A family penicillin-binding protein [Aliarcobacter butzleri]MCT7562258.1 PBP1A family penicillin-binding protein [Aliarcobacter butzleri]MCT7582433.1 PBP1A family penicillin-binding protein [Aliarcobacter butzleri]MCT7586837.1 PBP1A family penicillin-binding protein [Aliarcobacter butzleri]MCT7628908.1 PBP1A family penicillin-binding protein [Aliarcobacter butzleri]MDN5061785.1 PBP1A family penicillin-binding protein [Aliarcobacter butzleri]